MTKEMTTHDMTLEHLVSQTNIKKRFEEILGAKAPGFISSILSAVNTNPKLKEADPKTTLAAAAVAATLDLPINPSLGFAHLVPYGNRTQFQIGWRGLVQLALRTGQYKNMNVAELYEGELVSWNRVTGEIEIDFSKKSSETVIGYVAFFKLINGFEKYTYMTYEEVVRHGRRYSKSYENPNGRWKQDFNSMALKTVLKLLLSKWGILSVEMQQAITKDQAVLIEDEAGQEKVEYPDSSSSTETTTTEEIPFGDGPNQVSMEDLK
jgi:recombination protein RecT